ncbi:unnamed protein product [Pleuronectes platessa]|uniref:Uncharacterized protein n=1 Tax=Pleuronectes platessa TaxID=8262 RepID=A0A9N7VUV5_PLEPL|nr:unnamed protein product [Pleuronectes platessa]
MPCEIQSDSSRKRRDEEARRRGDKETRRQGGDAIRRNTNISPSGLTNITQSRCADIPDGRHMSEHCTHVRADRGTNEGMRPFARLRLQITKPQQQPPRPHYTVTPDVSSGTQSCDSRPCVTLRRWRVARGRLKGDKSSEEEEGETRSLVSGADGALKPGIGSS